jgi:hypothetical protein
MPHFSPVLEVGMSAHSLDVAVFEARRETLGELVAQLADMSCQALAVLDEISSQPDFAVGELDLAHASFVENPATMVSDTAFMARLDLQHRSAWIERWNVNTSESLTLSRCHSLRRRIVRSMIHVELALCEARGGEAELAQLLEVELEVALASRRAYLRFIDTLRDLDTELEAGRKQLDQALRLCAVNIARLVGRDIFSQLRFEDREQLRGLQTRLLDWARAGGRDELESRRLWMDLSICAELLAGIQHRSVLMTHDLEWTESLLESQRWRTGAEPVNTALRELASRDAELAAELRRPSPRTARIEARLTALHDNLAVALGRPPLVPRTAAERGAAAGLALI